MLSDLSGLVDLWVIKIKSLWSFAHVVRRDHVNRTRKRRSRSENMGKVCLSYSQNIKILLLSNMATTLFAKFTRCAKVCGLFFLIVLFGCWLAGQANSGHVVSTQNFYFNLQWLPECFEASYCVQYFSFVKSPSLDEKMDLLKFTNEQRCSKHDSKSEANVVKTIFAHVRK